MEKHEYKNIYEYLWGNLCGCEYCAELARASHAARVRSPSAKGISVETALYNLGCNVLGPILMSFLIWTLRHAEAAGTRRLYFLSRDGEVMMEVAKELLSKMSVGLELRYLLVSRTAVYPSLLGTKVHPETLEWLKEDNIPLTVQILAARLKVQSSLLFGGLRRLGADIKGLDTKLSKSEVNAICVMLTCDPDLSSLLYASGSSSMRDLSAYLEQEGLFDGTPFAVVDLGWHGGMQDVISVCFKDKLGANGISGYYFGVDLDGEPLKNKYGYFFSPDERTIIHRYRHLFRILIELLCSGSQGMVRGYQFDTGQKHSVPILAEIEHPKNQERIIPLRRGLMDFIISVDTAIPTAADTEHAKYQMLCVLQKLFFYPSRTEATAMGDFCFSADQAGHGVHRVAPPFQVRSMLQYLLKRSYAERASISSWFFASWRRSRWGIRLLAYPLVFLVRFYYLRASIIRFSSLLLLDSIHELGTLIEGSRGGAHAK